MDTVNKAAGGSEDLATQISHLRDQVESLIRDKVTPVVSDMAGRAEAAITDAGDTVRQQAQVVAGQVRARPLVAIVIAVGVGWLLGRAMR